MAVGDELAEDHCLADIPYTADKGLNAVGALCAVAAYAEVHFRADKSGFTEMPKHAVSEVQQTEHNTLSGSEEGFPVFLLKQKFSLFISLILRLYNSGFNAYYFILSYQKYCLCHQNIINLIYLQQNGFIYDNPLDDYNVVLGL